MKYLKKIFVLTLVLLFSATISFAQKDKCRQTPQMGPGPVVGISTTYGSLPIAVRDFVSSYFPNQETKSVTMNTAKDRYSIIMKNGEMLVIKPSGQWLNIMAAKNNTLSSKMLNALLPQNSYSILEKDNRINDVKQIRYIDNKGYSVMIKKIQDYFFDSNGKQTQMPPKQKMKHKK